MTDFNDHIELRQLADKYGIAIDRRDGRMLRSLFTTDGGMDVYLPDTPGPVAVIRGPEQLEAILEALQLYRDTFHFVGNFVVDVDGDTAHGVTYCIAHHWLVEDEVSHDETLLLTYDDSFVRTAEGWRFEVRAIRRKWTEVVEAGQRPLAIDLKIAERQHPQAGTDPMRPASP